MEPSDLTGAILDNRYRVIEAVAEGAMGVVYRAERLKLGRIVAVKVLHDELPNELSSRARFEIEATAMAKLEHPHCAAVIDVGIHGHRPFVVMDFVDGQDLKQLIATEGPLPIPRAVEILRQTLSGLAHAHELGIVHRDIKPANLVLSQKTGLGDHVKILDFGLARVSADKSNLTTGIVVGTPSYMAPEQIRGVPIDGRADLYACGILLFELLTGHKPFHSVKDDPIEVCSMHLKQPPPRLADKLPGVDFGELEAFVARALSKDPGARWPSAAEMSAALDAIAPRGAKLVTPVVGVPVEASAPTPGTMLGLPVVAATTAPRQATPTPVFAGAQQAVSLPNAPAAPQLPVSRRTLAMIGGGVLLLIIIIAVAAGGSESAPKPVAGSAALPPADAAVVAEPADPVEAVVARAQELVREGKTEAAKKLLISSREVYPTDARLPFMAGKLSMAKLFWAEGLSLFREAIRLDPAYQTNDELIKEVLRGFITTPQRDPALAAFLHDTIGPSAKPYLEAATTHSNPTVRNRASAELKRY